MATTSELIHSKGSIDLFDYIGFPLYGLAIVTMTGIGTFSIYGYDLTTVLYSFSGGEITTANVIAIGLLALGWVTNRAGDGFDDLDEWEAGTVVVGAVALLGIMFVPAVDDLVVGSDLWGTVALVALSGAYTVIGYY